MWKWLQKILGNVSAPATPAPAAAGSSEPANTPADRAEPPDVHPTAAESQRRLDAAWAAIGQSDSDLLTYLVNPQFTGAPAWPNMRQAFRVVRTPDSLIIASDGLADPAPTQTDDDDFPGYGAEVYVELPGLQDLPQSEVMGHWAFSLIESFARNVANWGGINASLNRYGVMSTALPVARAPAEGWPDADDNIGLLIGIPVEGRADRVQMPLGEIRLIPVTLLHPGELEFVANGGAEERAKLVDALAGAGIGHMSVAPRDAVI